MFRQKMKGKKMKKGILKNIMLVAAMLASIILITLTLSACGNNSTFSTGDVAATTTATEIKLTDGLGKEVVLDKPAERILVFAPSALEIIDGLNAIDTVIGVDSWSVDNKEPLAEGFEGFGDFQTLNMEKITAAAPDIIIGLVGWAEADIQKLADLGVKIYIVEANTIDEIYMEITNMGKMLAKDAEARELVDELKKQVETVSSKVAGLTEDKKPKVFYEVWNEPLMSAGKNTSINDLIEKAGGKNIVAADGLEGWPEYSIEKLIQNNPDIIIAPVSLAPDVSTIIDDSRFSSINAIVNKKVYVVPDNPITRPSQNIIKGLTMFAQAIHPEIFGEFSAQQ
ncbi:MAG TPA: ABC transporter substrate-binding protein [Methanosarcinales archaeon]|nr:ABC transporter substrate-binding protein [Methanosarcinales archaeon]